MLRISSANKQKIQFWFEKQDDPDKIRLSIPRRYER